jgi:hypothetical protein
VLAVRRLSISVNLQDGVGKMQDDMIDVGNLTLRLPRYACLIVLFLYFSKWPSLESTQEVLSVRRLSISFNLQDGVGKMHDDMIDVGNLCFTTSRYACLIVLFLYFYRSLS